MKTLIFVISLFYLLEVIPTDIDHYTYCESCLAAAREIEKVIKETSMESRQTVLENLINVELCEKLLHYQNEHVTSEKMKYICGHLLDSYQDRFKAALLRKEPKNVDIVLCYEESNACVGVKRRSFSDHKGTFTEAEIEALLHDNKKNVRFSKPVHSEHRRDEM